MNIANKDNVILTISGLKKIYHEKKGETLAIKDVSFPVKKGEFIAIVGSSGCGKTSILSIIANIEKASEGEIVFNTSNNPQIGYMLQHDTLFPHLSVLNNCLLGLKIKKQLNNNTKQRVIELLETYGLKEFINKLPNCLSGGMKQRVALIRTLAINPDILLLDEPYSALDYQTRLAVGDDVFKIIKKEKKSVIMVTHDLAEAISMASKIIVLSKRPAIIKNIYNINLSTNSNPIENRKAKEFSEYYDKIWKDLDIHV